MEGIYPIEYEMRCRHCGEGKEFSQVSYYHHLQDFNTNNLLNSEYQQAEILAESLNESEIICDSCGITRWDIYGIKVNHIPLFQVETDHLYFTIIFNKDEDGDIDFDIMGDQSVSWQHKHIALDLLLEEVDATLATRFSNTGFSFGGEAEVIISFKYEPQGHNIVFDRIEIFNSVGINKSELMEMITLTKNNI